MTVDIEHTEMPRYVFDLVGFRHGFLDSIGLTTGRVNVHRYKLPWRCLECGEDDVEPSAKAAEVLSPQSWGFDLTLFCSITRLLLASLLHGLRVAGNALHVLVCSRDLPREVNGNLDMAGWVAAAVNFAWLVSKKLAFPFIAVPMGIFSLSITLCCCWFLVTYVFCCVSWWAFLGFSNSMARLLSGKPHPREAQRKQPALPTSLRKLSDYNIPRRYSQPLRRPSVSSSRDCLVGDGTDRDFEGLGGWALSTDDDEALYMARTFGQEPCFDDVTLSAPRYRRSTSQSTGFVPSGPSSPTLSRTPAAYTLPQDDDKPHQAGSYQSRSSSPGAYFSLPASRSTVSLQRLRMASQAVPEHRRKNSSALSLTNGVTEFRDAATPFHGS